MTKEKEDSNSQKINHGLLAMGAGLMAMGTALISTSSITWIPIFVIASSMIILIMYLVNVLKNSDIFS